MNKAIFTTFHCVFLFYVKKSRRRIEFDDAIENRGIEKNGAISRRKSPDYLSFFEFQYF